VSERIKLVTRRDFVKGASLAGLGLAVGIPADCLEEKELTGTARVILVRDESAVNVEGQVNALAIQSMLDRAVAELFGRKNPAEAWAEVVRPEDVVGIKSNEWGPLPTPGEVENAIRSGLMRAGVEGKNIDIGDRGILGSDIFLNATALVNVRPMRAHHWAGVGSLIKNYIMFVREPWKYHDDSCADLATLWELPLTKGKTRLNVLVMLTPHFHGIGPHHFDPAYIWQYKGLLVGTDPVAVDSVGLEIIEKYREKYFGEYVPLKPPPHHIAYADTRHHLGVADLSRIKVVKLGWEENSLI
jgi:hypothetical protein